MPSWTAHHAGTAKHGQISTGGGCPWSFPWSFRHTSHGRTGPYQLDGATDLTSEDDTLRDGMDGCGSTSNPYGAGSSPARGTRLPGQRPAVLVVEMLPSAGQS